MTLDKDHQDFAEKNTRVSSMVFSLLLKRKHSFGLFAVWYRNHIFYRLITLNYLLRIIFYKLNLIVFDINFYINQLFSL